MNKITYIMNIVRVNKWTADVQSLIVMVVMEPHQFNCRSIIVFICTENSS